MRHENFKLHLAGSIEEKSVGGNSDSANAQSGRLGANAPSMLTPQQSQNSVESNRGKAN